MAITIEKERGKGNDNGKGEGQWQLKRGKGRAMAMEKGKGNGKVEGEREGGRVENPCILPVHKRREKKSSLKVEERRTSWMRPSKSTQGRSSYIMIRLAFCWYNF